MNNQIQQGKVFSSLPFFNKPQEAAVLDQLVSSEQKIYCGNVTVPKCMNMCGMCMQAAFDRKWTIAGAMAR